MGATKPILEAVAARLQAQVPGVEVALYPDNPSTWRMNHPRAALLVDYRGSRYGAPVDVGIVSQEREIVIGVSVVARSLHDAYGALLLTDAARLALLGQRLPDCRKVRLASERFVSQEAGLSIYELVFEVSSVVVEDADAPAGPALSRLVLDHGFEQEVLP